jgi:electron-transferring-flavoprotein dehydrogenase
MQGAVRRLLRSRKSLTGLARNSCAAAVTRPKSAGIVRSVTRSAVTTHPEVKPRSEDSRWDDIEMERYADQADVVIVGGGPAGLTAAIKLKRLANEAGEELRVCVFEKASEFGRHTHFPALA